jgi:hypothetical protein
MLPYLENDLADAQFLHGDWEFRLGDGPPLLAPVPAAWETYSHDKLTDGPAFYRRTFSVPSGWLGKQIVLEARAVSFDATVSVNGQLAGHHRGMWSPFQIDLTPYVHAGENTIEIEVWKPGARFPVRESLAGFLPDVCTTFGGLWQDIRLRAFDQAVLKSVVVVATEEGKIVVVGEINLFDKAEDISSLAVLIEVLDDQGQGLSALRCPVTGKEPGGAFFASLHLPDARWWSPPTPTLYSVRALLMEGEVCLARTMQRVGFRSIGVRAGQTWLNDSPLHLRGVLDWGWNPSRIAPTFTREEVSDHFAKARALGFNLVKLCLYVPDEIFFDVADETGMMLWLEMPMWLPRLTPEARALALQEYEAVFRRVRHHPSLLLVSLGCEMNAEADAGFLRQLDEVARESFYNVLHCDNSGSAEAYGGVLTGLGDFYDYHFYADPHFFPALVDHFDRAYQPAKPWIYGEFCDADTLRDFGQLNPQAWWLKAEVALERDDFLYTRDYQRRLGAAGVTDGGAALTHIARRQATAIRKFILERVRSRSATGGYVVTGWADTPITSSGMVDDNGELKFSPEEWRPFNADRVLTIDRERRRRWVGGDRPAHKDPFTWWPGEHAEIHVLLSNGGETLKDGRVEWELTDASGNSWLNGVVEVGGVGGGEVREVAVLDFQMPGSPAYRPLELVLNVSLVDNDGFSHRGAAEATTTNRWRLWAVPKPRLPSVLSVAGTLWHRHDFARIDREARFVSFEEAQPGRTPLLADLLTNELLDWVRAGGSAVLWQREPDRAFTRSVPFWREAIHVFNPHPVWDNVPHPGYADLRFFGVATDFALDREALQNVLGAEASLRPIWRRFDARAMTWAEYVVEVQLGAGRLVVSTLRFEGGLGYQPDTFDTNPWGAWILSAMLGVGG